jgi:hypothetical protein
MTKNPSTIAPDARLQDALRLMEDRPSQISVLPVLDQASGGRRSVSKLTPFAAVPYNGLGSRSISSAGLA